jgi:hypothetical protein
MDWRRNIMLSGYSAQNLAACHINAKSQGTHGMVMIYKDDEIEWLVGIDLNS